MSYINKIVVTILMFISVLAFSSCKKEYNCNCIIDFGQGSYLESKNVVKAKSIPDTQSQCDEMGQKQENNQTEPTYGHNCSL